MSRHLFLTLGLIALLAVSCAPLPAPIPAPATSTSSAALPNPASVYCEQQGGRLVIRTDATGAQSGICRFADGSECDEWAFYRGECSPGATFEAAPGAATYTSPALGVSFSYLPDQNGQTVGVLEQGDRIYVYPANMEPAAGQWVQVFPKQPEESLADAIRRVIMPGHPEADCQVTAMAELPGASGMQPASFEYAAITVRRAAGEDEAAVLPRWQTCPQPYTVVGGIGYFQADAAHPDRFVFFSIGQYAILAGPDLPWQETIRFE